MQNLIKHGKVVGDDAWRLVRDADEAFSEQENVILPLAVYLETKQQVRAGQTAVWLAPDQDPAVLLGDLPSLSLIAIDFPAFTDGRGYSIARLLRERHGYQGELRAVGDVLQDQLSYMAQVGIDAYAVRMDRDAADALAGLKDFSDQYQSTVLHPVPLLKRRVASVV